MAAKLTRLTHKIAIQLHLVAESLQFSLQAASPETSGYTLVLSSYLCPILPSGSFFPAGISPKFICSYLSHACHKPHPSHPPLLITLIITVEVYKL
jgi:hypothetical protein